MNVRPFYLTAKCDNRESLIKGGPNNFKEGMTISINQRDKGEVTTPYKIMQYTIEQEIDGEKEHLLRTDIYFRGDLIHHFVTTY